MKYNFLPIVFLAAALLSSCGKKTEDTAVVAADTTVVRDTVVSDATS